MLLSFWLSVICCETGSAPFFFSCKAGGTCFSLSAPQLGAVDAEIEVPSGENTELKHSPFKAWSRSVYSHACYAYCQGFLPCVFLPFQYIYLHFFFPKPLPIFSVLALANTWFLCRPTELNRSPCWMQVPMLSARRI